MSDNKSIEDILRSSDSINDLVDSLKYESQSIESSEEIQRIFLMFSFKTFLHIDDDDAYTHWIIGIYFLGALDSLFVEKDIIEYNREKNRILLNEFSNEHIFVENIIRLVEQSNKQIFNQSAGAKDVNFGSAPRYTYRASSLSDIYVYILQQSDPLESVKSQMSKGQHYTRYGSYGNSVILTRWSLDLNQDLMKIFNKGRSDISLFITILFDEEEYSSDAYTLLSKKNKKLDKYFTAIEEEVINVQKRNTPFFMQKSLQRAIDGGGCLIPIIVTLSSAMSLIYFFIILA